MATASTPAQRTYSALPNAVFGACVTVLGQVRASITRADAEEGIIVAQVGRGWLARISELTFQLRPTGDGTTQLMAAFRPVRWGGEPRLIAQLLQALDTLIARA